jgi:hypothetical protein
MLDSDAVFNPEPVMRRFRVGHLVTRAVIVAMLAGSLSAVLAACGQRGPLYLPDKENPDKRR